MRAGLESRQHACASAISGISGVGENPSRAGRGQLGSVGRAAIGKLGQRQRGAQFVAARALLACDGDGALEGFFGGESVGLVAPKKNLAADAMGFGVVTMQPGSL